MLGRQFLFALLSQARGDVDRVVTLLDDAAHTFDRLPETEGSGAGAAWSARSVDCRRASTPTMWRCFWRIWARTGNERSCC